MAGLTYVGNGGWLPGIPARDLDPSEVEALSEDTLQRLMASGLYQPYPSKVRSEYDADEGEE